MSQLYTTFAIQYMKRLPEPVTLVELLQRMYGPINAL